LISQRLLQVLKYLCSNLGRSDVRWVLAGSLSLALQGIEIEPNDIDILTDQLGALKINSISKKYEIKKVKYYETEKAVSFFGVFEIEDVKVEVMGDYKEKQGSRWVNFSKRLENPKIIEVDGIKIHVSSMKDQLRSYRRSKRPQDVEKVKKILQFKGNI
jgi:hypothetical protein